LPTCALALAESERYLPHLMTKIESILDKAGLTDEEIVVRMTGCPNGCGRPYLGEIGFVGRSPGLYNLYLGAAFDGARMNKLYAQDVDEERALALLEPILLRYAKERQDGEHFGDFTIRAGYVKPTLVSNQFHADVTLA
jgi:sulfite reductase (NADPH) hemoprotein beta-component